LEIYSVLTSAPFNPKITPIIAKQLIEKNILNIAKTISLTDEDYYKIVDKMVDSNFSGGIIYDSIVVECALKAKVDEILTLNSKDFLRLTDKISIKVGTF
jgi:predicted nucleic acid-binding protein